MEEPHALIERRGHVLIVTMNRPAVRNALSGPMMELMRQAFHAHVFSVVPKPVNPNVVLSTMLRALIRVYGTIEELPPPKPAPGEPTR